MQPQELVRGEGPIHQLHFFDICGYTEEIPTSDLFACWLVMPVHLFLMLQHGQIIVLCQVSHVIHQSSHVEIWKSLLTQVAFLTSLLDRNIAEEFSRLVNNIKHRLFVFQTCLASFC